MSNERRHHARVARLFEGSWKGASASGRCRISDISVGGCFVQTLAAPAVGEATVVTVTIGSHALSLAGKILYVEPNIGFAVRFETLPKEEMNDLSRLLEALQGR